MSNVAEVRWLPYLRPSIAGAPTNVVHFYLPPQALSDDLSTVAREPKLFALHEQLDQIAFLPSNWDGHRSTRPDKTAIANARQLLEDAYRQIATTLGWQSPYISASEDGEIVLEWWHGIRKLTIYVGSRQSTYLKSWGPHVINDMEDGPLPEDWIHSLWIWLFE